MNTESRRFLRQSVLGKRASLALGLLVIAGCGGNYQAPVSDQGQLQEVRAPIIARTSSDENGGAVVERGSSSDGSGRVSGGTIGRTPSAVQNQAARESTSSRQSATGQRVLNPSSHQVKAGDTLYSIAFQHDLDFRSLALANGLRSPYTIYVGQNINLDVSDLSGSSAGSAVNTSIGRDVSNNSVAQAQGVTSRSGGVLRQPIRTSNVTPTWDWPHSGRILQGFREAGNKGLNIQGRVGEAVLAAGSGDVVYAGRGVQGSGNLIIIRHTDRYLSAYAHNSSMLVSEGTRVAVGDKIAEVGENSAGDALLHFEIRLDGKSVDPNELLPSRR